MRARNTLALGGFRGVDLSSSPLEVAGSRASLAYNLISENGVNHKRHGFEELAAFEGRINGIFPFREEGGTEILLVHAGTALWRFVKGESPTKISGTLVLADQRSQCFCRDGVAFLVGCGEYLAYGKHHGSLAYSLVPVSEIAYVPTTTIISFGGDRYTHEAVSLLTPWRKNQCMLPASIANGEEYSYFMDDIVATEYGEWEDDSEEFYITVEIDHYTVKFKMSDKGELYDEYGRKLATFGYDYGRFQITINAADFLYARDFKIMFCASSKVTTANRNPEKVEMDNRKIKNCRFGTTFGVNGAADRLFLSGNPEHPNKDFFSEAEDFTYFPDGNVLTVGDALSPVTGYARLSDATLAVFKGESMDDASIYFRTGEERTITDTDGHEVPAAFFPTVAGTAGEHLIGAHAVANLSGDILFLSKNGVFGVELSANVSSTERYARERSRAIFEDLKRQGVSENAASIVFRGRYYLAIGDEENTCYVADSRYKATFAGTTDVGYEWWVWKGIPAHTFAIYEDGLLFGTRDGKLCRFGDGFADVTYSVIGSGAVTQSAENPAALVVEDALRVKDGDRMALDGALFGLLLDNCSVKDGYICLPDGDEQLRVLAKRLFDGAEVYADDIGESGLAINTKYIISDFDIGGLTFRLSLTDGSYVSPRSGGFRLSRRLAGVECRIKTVKGQTMLADAAGDVWMLVDYDSKTASSLTGRLTHYTPVVAEWYTPVIDFGTAARSKTLLGLTLSLGEETTGVISYGYDTRRGTGERRLTVGAPIDFGALDFGCFSFSGKRYTCSYTKRLCLRNFNYLRLFWRSEDDVDCVINGIEVVYKMANMNRGLR